MQLNLRTTLILLLVFLTLGSYYFFVERKKPTEQEKEKQEKSVLHFDRLAMQSLEIAGEGESIRCVKTDKGWEMQRTLAAKCDEAAVASVLASLSSLQATRFLPADSTSLAQFGLEEPSIRVAVASSSPPDSHWLFVGDETPTGDAYYAFADGRDRVALIPSSAVDANYKKSPFDLRDKAVLDFTVAQTRGLEIDYDHMKIKCERATTSAPWNLAEPITASGDDTEINSVLWDIENAKVRKFIDQETADLSAYGLKNPAATVRVYIGAGRTLKKLDFGAETEEGGTVYAKRLGQPGVVMVDKRLLDKVKKEPIDLRQKRLFNFATTDIASIEISMGDSAFSCVRDTTGEWFASGAEHRHLKKWKMNGVASQISFLRAFSFVDNPKQDLASAGLSSPQVTVVVTLSDTTTATLELGSVEGDELYVRAGGQIAVVSAGLLHDMKDIVRNPPYVEEEMGNEQPK
jgi:hypothetical protein